MAKISKRPVTPAVKEDRPRPKTVKRATNLTLDPDAVAGGEQYGKQHGISLSQLVNSFLHALRMRGSNESDEEIVDGLTPAVRRLYGVAAGGTTSRASHRAHLSAKYGSRD